MRTFVAVVEHASFSSAARALRQSPAATTRAVAQLESALGVVLLARTTRSVRATDRGAIYAERCRRILADLDEAAAAAAGGEAEPRGALSITAPVMFGQRHVLPIAEALLSRHPELTVRLTLLDRVTHLVEEGFDAAFRLGAPVDSALVGVHLTDVRPVVVASPAYLASAGEPLHPRDLRRHSIVAFEGIGGTNLWRFGREGRESVTVTPRLSVNSAAAAGEAAVNGSGITRMFDYQAAEALAAGRLCRVLVEHEPPSLPVTLLFQSGRRTTANIVALSAAARAHFGRSARLDAATVSRAGARRVA